MSRNEPDFEGFSARLPRILAELRDNNSREWYAAHRDEYTRWVAEPLRALGEELIPIVLGADERLQLKLSRVHRDTRFSADKSPYRTEAWFVFRRTVSDWLDTPAFFLEVSPGGCRWGMGFYAARPRTMEALRETAVADASRFARACEVAVASGFCMNGEEYRRARRVDSDLPAQVVELHRRRNIYMSRNERYDERLFSPDFAGYVAEGFAALVPFYGLLREVADRSRAGTERTRSHR